MCLCCVILLVVVGGFYGRWRGEGRGVHFRKFVDSGAESLLDVADTVIFVRKRIGSGLSGLIWTYNKAGLPRACQLVMWSGSEFTAQGLTNPACS